MYIGHVALLTDLMATLAERKPALQNSLVVVFIANEENGTFKGVGVDQLALEGHMTDLLKGPLFWIDSAGTPLGHALCFYCYALFCYI